MATTPSSTPASDLTRKPRPDFPLFRHASGQWAKKIRGKLHYFGKDPLKAEEKYLADREYLQAGRTPPNRDGATVQELCNRFLNSKRQLMETGELSPLTFRTYHETSVTIAASFGKSRMVEDLGPDDFESLRKTLAKRRGPVALGNEVQRVRTIFKYGFESGLMEKPVRFGPAFTKPSRKSMRRARAAAGSRMLEAPEVRQIIDACPQPLRAMAYLGVNCGFGQTDVSSLPLTALDLDRGWIDFPRPKTGIPRRCPIWPETVKVLQEAIVSRPKAKSPAEEGMVFLTRFGHRWTRVRPHDGEEKKLAVPVDAIAARFTKILRVLGIKRAGSFYSLRHVFRTVADASKDQPAVNSIMGHADESMAATYRERISDERLRTVANVVHDWLYAPDSGSKPTGTPVEPETEERASESLSASDRPRFRIVG